MFDDLFEAVDEEIAGQEITIDFDLKDAIGTKRNQQSDNPSSLKKPKLTHEDQSTNQSTNQLPVPYQTNNNQSSTNKPSSSTPNQVQLPPTFTPLKTNKQPTPMTTPMQYNQYQYQTMHQYPTPILQQQQQMQQTPLQYNPQFMPPFPGNQQLNPQFMTPLLMNPPFPMLFPTQPTPQKEEKETGPDVTKMDVESMLDVTSYGGVDITEESDNLGALASLFPSRNDEIHYTARSSLLNLSALKKTVMDLALPYKITQIDNDYLNYIAFAAQERIRILLERMSILSKHRTMILHHSFLSRDKRDLYNNQDEEKIDIHVIVNDDIKSTLNSLEKYEKEDEKLLKLERGLGVEDEFSGSLVAINMSTNLQPKKVKVVLPEEIKTKMANATALKAAGGSLKSWMIPGNSNKVTPQIPPVPQKPALKPYQPPMGIGKQGKQLVRLSRPMTQKEARRIILKDALACLENDASLKMSPITYKYLAFIK